MENSSTSVPEGDTDEGDTLRPFGGHFAAKGLYNTQAQHYQWEGMFTDTLHHCRSCLTCAAYQGTGRKIRPPLQPIPVGAAFDILEMPVTVRENRYVIVFVDYLTKWVEAYPAEDQSSEMIARLLVDNVVSRHGVPSQLLLDRGANLLSTLIQDEYSLLGMKKITTTSYHPQTDGFVERMNRTLRTMLAKHAHTFGPDWDLHLITGNCHSFDITRQTSLNNYAGTMRFLAQQIKYH